MIRIHLSSLAIIALLLSCSKAKDVSVLTTPFETSDSLETATYDEGIAWWRALEEASPYVCVQTAGTTDDGKPLHLVVITGEGNFAQEKVEEANPCVWLINNGIHPGEPDGIDASMLFARELLSADNVEEQLEGVCLLIIPFYNVGGALNRNCCSRANQNGPLSYGFRGNANNLDLNRDFIKADSRNAQTFLEVFRDWNPDVYLETHVSNGADYQYTMTYLTSQADKLSPALQPMMRDHLIPGLVNGMESKGDPMTPYVNVHNTSPDSGFSAFYDSPRYSTGFTALHHSFGLLTETHMLKPFAQRVESTRKFLHTLLEVIQENSEGIQTSRAEAFASDQSQRTYPLHWTLDKTQFTTFSFNGYEAYTDTSAVTGQPQLYYDQNRPWTRDVRYYNTYKASHSVEAPTAYLLPASRREVLDRLRWNGVEMKLIEKDTSLRVTAYKIAEYETNKQPFEGHYLHSDTRVEPRKEKIALLPAESHYLISTAQPARRFIIEVLEPEARDSYFNWNFFDEILQQKEWFSGYVFDPEAAEMLETNDALRKEFEQKKATDSVFASNAFQQQYFLYQQSAHFEHDRYQIYPVLRIE